MLFYGHLGLYAVRGVVDFSDYCFGYARSWSEQSMVEKEPVLSVWTVSVSRRTSRMVSAESKGL